MFLFAGNAFWPFSLKNEYGNRWPSDGLVMCGTEVSEFLSRHIEGFEIGEGEDGRPKWVKVTFDDEEKRLESEKSRRTYEINNVSWYIERHRGQLELGIDTSITEEQYKQVLEYIQKLRDWPSCDGWPDVNMPEKPEWML